MAKILTLRPLTPESPVTAVPGVGEAVAPRLAKLGIVTVRDLLYHLPRRYEDSRDVVPIAELRPGEVQTSLVRVTDVRAVQRRMHLLQVSVEDSTGVAEAIWFNQPFRQRDLRPGTTLFLRGKVKPGRLPTFQAPVYERPRSEQRHLGRLAPVYPETHKLSTRMLRSFMEPALAAAVAIPDPVPPPVRERESLPDLGEALRQAHFPDDQGSADRARERIAFEELFLIQVAAERARRRRLGSVGVTVPYDVEAAREFTRGLPFKLTDGQRVAAHEILTDMAKTGPMNRLLQGDVGSGKTVVAAMAALLTHRAGLQTAVMAPTEILARQHAQTLDALLAPHGLVPRLLVGSTTATARREVLEALAGGQDSLIVGTHALIEDDVVLRRLGLAVVDEQHRFGVAQRQRLRQKSGAMPNFLAMTATPIPRSLALTLYGDVDVSELRELPPGRQAVDTSVVAPHRRDAAYGFVGDQLHGGRQAFVICPLIEESDKLGVRSATAEFERLSTGVFADFRVDLLHGRLPAKEKEERMRRFASGETDLLVATSVVEVGVDLPNATIMLVEGAERFGLAQLHQFRGRVGRGEHRSYCLLFEGGTEPDEQSSSRLDALATTQSGFDLAELDLKLRGAGDVVGMRQHGLPEMRVADLLDLALAARARRAAVDWLDSDPALSRHLPLREALDRYTSVFDLD